MEIGLLREGIELLQHRRFESLKLGALREELSHGQWLRRRMNAWAQFEAIVALRGYEHEHLLDACPEFTDGDARVEARALGHPLLPRETGVRNDLTLGAEGRFIIISGSNMAGKSTLLRAIGVNVAPAYANGPVGAESMRLSQLSLCASLAVADPVLEGKPVRTAATAASTMAARSPNTRATSSPRSMGRGTSLSNRLRDGGW